MVGSTAPLSGNRLSNPHASLFEPRWRQFANGCLALCGAAHCGHMGRCGYWRVMVIPGVLLLYFPSGDHFSPGLTQAPWPGHLGGNGMVQLLEVVARNACKHVVLRMPVHTPVQKLQKRVKRDRACALAKVRIILFQATVLGDANQIGQQVGRERCQGDDQDEHPITRRQ